MLVGTRTHRWLRLLLTAVCCLALTQYLRNSYLGKEEDQPDNEHLPRSGHQPDWNDFTELSLPGFVNTGHGYNEECQLLRRESTISVQKSRYLYDKLPQIAAAVDSHPLVVDEYKKKESDSEEEQRKIRKAWARLSGSSVWLPDQQVYLVVTRVIFHVPGNLAYSFMSWLRGQLYDEDWNHLDNHTIHWGGNSFTFPTIFKVDADYDRGGIFYGPEDPRVIIEEGVDGAEPVIIYNSITKSLKWSRAMYIFRPFSNQGTIMKLTDSERRESEKNWAPFYVRSVSPGQPENHRQPSEYLHFVHTFDPLTVIRCHLSSGLCEHVYPESPNNSDTIVRGGTNFVPIPLPHATPGFQAWAAFIRTTMEKTCGPERFYRPEFIVMVRIGSAFHIAYISEPTDFGSAVMELKPDDDPCETGRILLPNSIAHWDTRPNHDILTLTMSVDDKSVQILRIRGLLHLVMDLPIIRHYMSAASNPKHELMLMNETWEYAEQMHAKSNGLLKCTIDVAKLQAHLTGWKADMRLQRVAEHNDVGDIIGYMDKEKWRENEKQKEREWKEKEERERKEKEQEEKENRREGGRGEGEKKGEAEGKIE